VVGAAHVVTDPELVSGYCVDWTRRFQGPAAMVIRPGSTQEVAEAVSLCADAGRRVVVQGGNTGLVGGSVPAPGTVGTGAPVVLSTRRLAQLGPVDHLSSQITAGAGVTLASLQGAARAEGLEFPVDLAARESATVGGMISTNAGGVHVLRYGGMRGQVLGVEAVLPGGQVISRLSGLVKDNTGYDLSQLLIGSEGTLGIVTAARLRLVPHLAERVVLLLGLGSMQEASVLVAAFRASAPSLTAAEVFFREGMELVCAHAGLRRPMAADAAVYLLIECAARSSPLEEVLEALSEHQLPEEATAVATDAAGRERLWSYRERHTEAVSALGIPHKLDVTLPMGRLEEFETAVRQLVERVAPSSRTILWGHVGDGNIHVNVVGPDPDDELVDLEVCRLVAGLGGSISAEHGIGRAKAGWLSLVRTEEEIGAMQSIKSVMDPRGVLNPGVLLAAEAGPR
jgi:FAD/FMN-containing dehydrogenase